MPAGLVQSNLTHTLKKITYNNPIQHQIFQKKKGIVCARVRKRRGVGVRDRGQI